MALSQLILILGVLIGFSILGIVVFKTVKIVRPHERGLIERFGKYQRTAPPGIAFLLPFIEDMVRIDLRERMIDVPPQDVITKDDAVVTVDALVYLEVVNPVRVEYNVENFESAITKLAQTSLRDIIGTMELDRTLSSREKINHKLRKILDDVGDRWGINVSRVELKEIEPPEDIVDAMAKQMKAERTKRSKIREAEGVKKAKILEAEGEADSIKKLADAEKYKQIAAAEGESESIENVYSAIHKGGPTKELVSIKYLETLQEMADGKATKIFFPVESSGVLGSIGGIGELLKGEELPTKAKVEKETEETNRD